MCQGFQADNMAVIKGIGFRREDLYDPNHLTLEADGGGQNGSDSESSAACEIHSEIVFGVVTAKSSAATYTLSGKTRRHVHVAAERWCAWSYAGSANH
ncbi:MAG TPA: hypothetical protein VF011_21265 [Terriglobales bacterium]